jgi:hypothetical protein
MNYAELVTAISDITENTFQTTDMNMFIKQAEQKIYNTVQLPNLRKNVTGVTSTGNKYLSCPGDFLSVYSLAVINASGNYTFLLDKDVNFIREAFPNPTSTGLPSHYAIFGPQSTDVRELTLILGPTPDAVYTTELHYYYYPESIVPITGVVTTLQLGAAGTNYQNGTYPAIPLNTSTGSGTGCTANVTVAAGAITSIVVNAGGSGYVVGDQLLLLESYITSSGRGGYVAVTVISVTNQNPSGTTWLGDNFDSALLNGALMEAIRFMKGEQDLIAVYKGMYDNAMVLLKQLGDGKDRQDAYRSGQTRVQVI